MTKAYTIGPDGEPRYVVIRGREIIATADSLVDALDVKHRHGGLVYEPLAMTAAERVHAEPADDGEGLTAMFDEANRMVAEREADEDPGPMSTDENASRPW